MDLHQHDSEAKKKKKKGLITGLIVGGAVGSVLSLLFAPDPGEETRKKAASKWRSTKGFFTSLWSRFKRDDEEDEW